MRKKTDFEALEQGLRAVADKAVLLLEELEEYLADLLKSGSAVDSEIGSTLLLLDLSCQETSRAALVLVRHRFSWDAEVLVRTLYEGTIKFAYIASPPTDEQLARVREFKDVLGEIADLKMHDRINQMLDFLVAKGEDVASVQWRPITDMLLSEDRAKKLRNDLNKKQRRMIQDRWSFLPLIERMMQSGTPGHDGLIVFVRSYGLMSHYLHKDGTGLGAFWSRMTRPSPGRDAADLAHRARIVSDIVSLAAMRVLFASSAYDGTRPSLLDKVAPVSKEIEALQAAFYEIEYGGAD